MTAAVAHQRCWNHLEREAVARCPECTRSFCRECIVEHEDRILCASCLQRLLRAQPAQRARFTALLAVAGVMLGFFTAWLFFYFAGRILLTFPASFHDGTVWHSLGIVTTGVPPAS